MMAIPCEFSYTRRSGMDPNNRTVHEGIMDSQQKLRRALADDWEFVGDPWQLCHILRHEIHGLKATLDKVAALGDECCMDEIRRLIGYDNASGSVDPVKSVEGGGEMNEKARLEAEADLRSAFEHSIEDAADGIHDATRWWERDEPCDVFPGGYRVIDGLLESLVVAAKRYAEKCNG